MIFHKYPKIFRIGHEKVKGIFSNGKIIIEEKMDGANVRWMYDTEQNRIRFGSRNVELTDNKEYGQFKKFAEWIKQLNPDNLQPDLIYYAEYMIPHTINYDWSKTPLILGFDILDGNKFIEYDVAEMLFSEINVPFVPVIDVIDAKEITKDYLDKVIPESRYYNGLAEGVVFKNYEKQIFGKLIAEPFKEVNKNIFGGSPKKAKTPEEYLLEKYFTPRRIEKVIRALLNEGYTLDMKLMNVLPKRVLEDVIEEEAYNIFTENITVNLKKLRKMIPKRCVSVLQRVMTMNELEVYE